MLEADTENWTRLFAGNWAKLYHTGITQQLDRCTELLHSLKLPQPCTFCSVEATVVNPYVLLTTCEWQSVQNTARDDVDAALDIFKALPIDVLLLRWVNYQLVAHTAIENTVSLL